MSVAPSTKESTPTAVVVDRATHLRRAWLLLAFAAWNVVVWGTRLRNLFTGDEEFTVAFIVVHTVLFVGGLGGAALLAVVGQRMRREAAAAGGTS